MPNSLVTGGAGAIGSRLVARLIEAGHRVAVLDDLSSGFAANLPASAELIAGSVSDAGMMDRIYDERPFDFVFHLAALFANQNSVDNPDKDLQVNGLGTLNAMQSLVRSRHAKRVARFLYVSSSCVYGRAVGAVDESADKKADTPYAVTKLMGEFYARYFQQQYELPVTIVRPFNSYGPGERPGKYRNVIPNFIQQAFRGETLRITGTGEETRDFTFVDDTVECFLRAVQSQKSIGEAYNVGTGRETSIGDLAKLIVEATGSTSKIEYVPRRDWDHVARRCANITKLRSDLEFEPKTTIDVGVSRTVEWIRKTC